MLDFDPLSRPVAIAEILLLLAIAACIGWLLARLIFNDRINTLRTQIAEKESELEDCRRAKTAVPKKKEPGYLAAQPVGQFVDSPNKLAVPPANYNAPETVEVTHIPATSEAAVLARITSRSPELNFDRIGRATPAEADDLKDIVGIGPLLERKLHSLGIYTYRQIANFTKEDMAKVNEIIEFFPGRIERDNWVGQAKLIFERKYGSKL
ncbi:hypothetical protein GCM10023189_41190 [Nibrella saemangeumensis]|uniref:NADH-quinone oxidoreductase subunit E n=1 Tax=Nibrella saemangeumensis TaxID=1084526 RepID=A0ABP8N8V3_9BACT